MTYRLLFLLIFPIFCFSQNFVDENGMKQGKWIQKYDNGTLRYEGSFVNNMPNGIFKHYTKKGVLKANLEYFNGGLSSSAYIYHANGELSAVGVYTESKKDTLWKYYDNNGNLIKEENYRDGKQEGIAYSYYADGKLLETVKFVNNLKEGELNRYYRSDTLKIGSLMLNCFYINNQLEGPYTLYYPDGMIDFEGVYVKDLKHGFWKFFEKDGSLKLEVEYDNGILLTTINE